jgi:hypothetical protein
MKIQLTSTAPIAVETYVDGNIVLGQFEYHPADEFGTPPHFILFDEVSTDFPILWELRVAGFTSKTICSER